MARRLIPLLDRVLIERVQAATKTAGGVLLPEMAVSKASTADALVAMRGPMPAARGRDAWWQSAIQTRSQPISARRRQRRLRQRRSRRPQVNEGVVVAVGPGRRNKDGEVIPVSVKAGDKVLLPEYGGNLIKLQDKEWVPQL